ncbi:hypothetical protein C6495_02975 [Candidatus Poribacteria bacterium]|nr:MAG: hypothetical protein C6495_02975 [Candidatus Poribacteria bacterium]
MLPWRGAQKPAVPRGMHAWLQLPSALLQTRYRLKAVERTFGEAEEAAAIQAVLRQWGTREHEFHAHYLIAQPHAGEPCYHISEYVQRCVAGELAIAERLRGRTMLHLYQTEEQGTPDLLSATGVSVFIEQVLLAYLNAHGKASLIGFACELPRFLSILESEPDSVPWSRTLENAVQSYLPLVFYETYDSAAVRSTFWRAVTMQFANCFLAGVRDFCHQEGLRFAVSISESARTLEFELGAMLAEVDCPVLHLSDKQIARLESAPTGRTARRFVVAKWVSSNARYAGLSRKGSGQLKQFLQDVALGFNLSVSGSPSPFREELLAIGYPKRQLLMLAPTQSLWTKPDEKQWNYLTKGWGWLCQTVSQLGYDFRIVSEGELRLATVDKKCRGLYFNEPADVYRVVLLPSCISLQEETVNCLRAFTKAKGKLIANEPVPYLLNGRIGLKPYPLEQLIYGRRTTILRGPLGEREAALKKYLRKWVTRVISVYAKPENEPTLALRLQHRVTEEAELFYLYNATREPIDVLIEMRGTSKSVEEYCLLEGTRTALDFWHADGQTYLNCAFVPEQARLFVRRNSTR